MESMVKMMLLSNMDRRGLEHWVFLGALVYPPLNLKAATQDLQYNHEDYMALVLAK
jgi:hypothetical protein